jgi:hypothetical protein
MLEIVVRIFGTCGSTSLRYRSERLESVGLWQHLDGRADFDVAVKKLGSL